MANGVDFTYTIGARLDTQNLVAAINKVQQDINKQPLSVQIKGDINARVGDIANFAKVIGTTTDKIESVKVVYQEFYDKVNNTKLTVPTKEVTTFKNELGNTVTKVRELDTTLAAIAKADKKGFDFLGTTTATAAIGETSRKMQKAFDDMDTSVKKASDSAEQFLAKTKSMSGPSVEAGRALAEQIQRTSEEYRKLKDAGDVAGASKLSATLEKQREALRLHSEEIKRGAVGLQNFGASIQRVLKQSILYGLAMRAIRMAQQKVNEAFKYAVDLNTEMTKIKVLQVEGAKTAYEINNLADSFNRLAKEMGASTLQVAQGSVEWLRQGKTIEETQKLLKSTLMLSKLGDLEAGDATKYLTSTLNGYKMEASEAASVVDKLVAVDNVAATSVRELATALQYSAAIASETGVSFEQLVSYIGVVSETTRQNAESIGQGMKTMLTRMQDIKGGKLDEDGLGINNVEIALKRANIELRDSRDSFRDFGSVLEELAGKWGTLSETEQAFIAKSIAGIRQVNMFTVLMQNMGRAIELQEVQFSSAGLAADRYQIYLESLQAKLSQLKATWEGLIQDTIKSGFVANLIDSGKNILEYADKIGGLKNTLILLAGAFLAIKLPLAFFQFGPVLANIKTLASYATKGITGISYAMTELGISTQAAAAAATAGISLLIAGIVALGVAIERAIITQKEYSKLLKDSLTQTTTSADKLSQAKALQKEFAELTNISETTKDTKEQEDAENRLFDVRKQLIGLFPGLMYSYDEYGRVIGVTTDEINQQIDGLENLIELQKKQSEQYAMNILFSKRIKTDDLSEAEAQAFRDKTFKTEASAGLEGFGESPLATIDIANTKALEDAYVALDEALNPETGEQDYKKILEARKDYEEVMGMYVDAMSSAGLEASTEFVKNIDSAFPELKAQFEIFLAGISQSAKAEVKKQEEQLARETFIRGFTAGPSGYNETQAGNAFDYKTKEDMSNIIYSQEIKSLTESLVTYDKVLDQISKKEFVSDDDLAKIARLGIEYERTADGGIEFYKTLEGGGKLLINSHDAVKQATIDDLQTRYVFNDAVIEGSEAILAGVDAMLDYEYAVERDAEALEALDDSISSISDAQKEFAENGYVSASTAAELVSVNENLASSLIRSGDGFIFNANSALETEGAVIQAMLANAGLRDVAYQVQNGMFAAASAMLAEKLMAGELDAALIPLIDKLAQLGAIQTQIIGGYSGGGAGGAKQEDPRIKENEELIEQLEEQIDLHEDEKDAIKDSQDQYHDWIDLKKKALELTKEENDYLKEQSERTTNLAKLKKEIAMLELDNTEEARAKRLELEEQAAELEKEITENTEERRYDLQMQALENLKDAFDAMIEKQIEAIDLVIEGIRDQIEVIRDIIEDLREEGKSGGSTGGYPSVNNTIIGGGGGPGAETALGGALVTIGGSSVFIPAGDVIQKPFNPNGTHYNQNSIDIGTDYGSIIGSPVSGALLGSGMSSAYGGWAAVGTPENPYMVYHLDKKSIEALTGLEGTMYEMGQQIGVSGNTGGVNGIPHVGIMAGASWNQAEYDAAKANRMVNDTVEWAFKQPGKNDQIAKDLLAVAEYLDSGILEEAIGVGLNNVTKQIDISSNDNKDAIIADLEDGFISVDDAVTNGLIENGESINSLQIATENGTKTLVYTFKDGFYGFAIMITKAIKKAQPKKELVAEQFGSGIVDVSPPINKPGEVEALPFHNGGLVESHHNGDFAGNLRSNEVFSKLLKGEYVATEGQMDNFLKNILPTIATNIPTGRYNQSSNINVSMPINVEGNLDKSVIPDIKKIANQVIEEINRSLIARGYVRPANNTLS